MQDSCTSYSSYWIALNSGPHDSCWLSSLYWFPSYSSIVSLSCPVSGITFSISLSEEEADQQQPLYEGAAITFIIIFVIPYILDNIILEGEENVHSYGLDN